MSPTRGAGRALATCRFGGIWGSSTRGENGYLSPKFLQPSAGTQLKYASNHRVAIDVVLQVLADARQVMDNADTGKH
jgi:hypothetical protein